MVAELARLRGTDACTLLEAVPITAAAHVRLRGLTWGDQLDAPYPDDKAPAFPSRLPHPRGLHVTL